MKTLNENSNVKVEGHVVITDIDSGEVLLDKYNAINFQNFAFAVAQAMSGGTTYAVNKLAFGYGGTSIDSGTGAITYNAPQVTGTSGSLYTASKDNTDPSNPVDLQVNVSNFYVTDTANQPYSDLVCNTVLDYNVIQFLQSVAEVHMCPSLIEGWGQYIDEGRRAKAVVLTLDAPPMNELITDKSNGVSTGVLVKATRGPSMKQLLPPGWTQYFTKNHEYNKFLYITYKTSINDLYNGINKILNMLPDQGVVKI